MGSRIVRDPGAFYIPKRKPTKDAEYLAFVHELPCVITGQTYEIEACHVSFAAPQYGHFGRGKQRKASDRWVLPMTAWVHLEQHKGDEEVFWDLKGISPHLVCLVIHGLFCEAGMDAVDDATRIIKGGLRFARTF